MNRLLRKAADSILFGPSRFAEPMQKAVQFVLRGPKEAEIVFSGGPAAGRKFHCLTSEKIFFLGDGYEADLIRPIQEVLRPGMTAYDVGAHTGYWTIVFAELCGERGRVFAFEPCPSNRARLLGNVELNKLSNVSVVGAAVSDRDGVSQLHEEGSMSTVGSSGIRIETVSLDLFCLSNPFADFLLIDIEGHAGQALKGARRMLSSRRPPCICELHDAAEQKCVQEELARHGYSSCHLDGDKFPLHILATSR